MCSRFGISLQDVVSFVFIFSRPAMDTLPILSILMVAIEDP
jgi:hypothetical protein